MKCLRNPLLQVEFMDAAERQIETIGHRLQVTRGRTTGFDYLRVGLSAAVIIFHSAMTSYGPDINRVIETGWSRPFVAVILPAFFALSGFLVTASLIRCKTIFEFLTLRVVRLVPALFFEVCISALLLGPFLTSVSLGDYFHSPLFRAYFLNIVGHIQFRLPGMFLNNPDPDIVNRQLWTIPVELKCYAALAGLYLLGASKSKWRMGIIFVACLILFPINDWWRHLEVFSATPDAFLNVPGKVLIGSFLAGITLFLFKDDVRLSRSLFAACAVLSYALLISRYTSYLAAAPIAYMTIFVGLIDTKPNRISKVGEYSYGLYIYGFVIQQTYAQLFPGYRIWWMNASVCLVVTLAFSFASWRLIEKPALDGRKHAVNAVESVVDLVAKPFSRLLRLVRP